MIILKEETAINKIKEYASSKGGVFQGFVGGVFITNITKCILRCEQGHEWATASYNNLLNKGSWCPICNKNKRLTEEESRIRIAEYAESRGGKFINFTEGKYKGNVTFCNMECAEGHRWQSRYGNLINSKSWCPLCVVSGYNCSQTGYLYILSSEEGCMKIGITNSPVKRFAALRKSTPFNFDVLEVLESVDGSFVMEIERKAHSISESMNYKGFDGATEWFKHDGSVIEFIKGVFKNI